jgi:hypothetical protein
MRSGLVLYLQGIPGSAKSAMGEAICRKIIWWDDEDPQKERHLGIQYIDLRLSDKDETDLGSYPVLKNVLEQILRFSQLVQAGLITPDEFEKVKKKYLIVLNSDDIDSLSFAVPDWAIKANTTPSIIHVEELNRCDIRVRNAALQLLNEKRIGSNFQFNKNVFWMASGNYGEMDKTEVEEMDLALSNRLIILEHELTADEWAREYAREHCWDVLVDYIVSHPDEIYKPPADGTLQYATARSWTHLSDYVLTVFGKNPDLATVVSSINFQTVGTGCVGSSLQEFVRYCNDTVQVSIKDIYERWDEVKEDVITFNRARTTELMNNLKAIPLETLEKIHIENIVKFLKSMCSEWIEEWEYEIDDMVYYSGYTYHCKQKNTGVFPNSTKENDKEIWEVVSETDSMKSHSNDDEITNYLIHLVDTMVPKNQDRHKFIVRVFRNKAQFIQKMVNNERHKEKEKKTK